MANYTPNYQLHQWTPEDKFLRTDFNEDLNKIDTALGEAAAAAAQVGKLGNCQIVHVTYTGSGKTSRTQTFTGKPLVVMVARTNDGYSFIAWRGMKDVMPHHQQYGTLKLPLTWGANSLAWSHDSDPERALNQSGAAYQLIALLDRSA
nr:hypothetical protein [uncultured Flavonifractor sp.]